MLIRPITYENYDGETVTETFHFNIAKWEIIEWDTDYPGGIVAHLETVIKTEDKKLIIETMKKLLERAYGVREGKSFIKNDEVWKEFQSSAAYHQILMELSFDANAAADWIKGVLPQDLVHASAEQIQKAEADLKKNMAEALGTAPTPSESPSAPTPTT